MAQAARALVGARFRPHGRDPRTGLDCVGLVAAALREAGFRGAVPTGYALRGNVGAVAAMLDVRLARAGDGAVRAGDVLLFDVGGGQPHLGIATAGGVVHADAALRRVVERPGPFAWGAPVGTWRWPG